MIQDRPTIIVVSALAAILFVVVIALVAGLFDHRVDNDKIFPIISHAFDTIVGCFVGILGGKALGNGPKP